jgi:hypothetical protein
MTNCEHCGTKPIARGKSTQAKSVQRLRLCYTCYQDKGIRKAQRAKLGLPQPSPNRRGKVPGPNRARKQAARVKPPRKTVSRQLDKAFDGFAKALAEVERIAEKDLVEAIAALGTDAVELVACVRATIARTFRQRKRLADMMAKLKLKANEGAADLRRRIAELKGAERDVRREIGKLPRPEGEKHEAEE